MVSTTELGYMDHMRVIRRSAPPVQARRLFLLVFTLTVCLLVAKAIALIGAI